MACYVRCLGALRFLFYGGATRCLAFCWRSLPTVADFGGPGTRLSAGIAYLSAFAAACRRFAFALLTAAGRTCALRRAGSVILRLRDDFAVLATAKNMSCQFSLSCCCWRNLRFCCLRNALCRALRARVALLLPAARARRRLWNILAEPRTIRLFAPACCIPFCLARLKPSSMTYAEPWWRRVSLRVFYSAVLLRSRRTAEDEAAICGW